MANFLTFQQGKEGTGTGKTPAGVTYANNTTAGSLLICMVQCPSSGADTVSVLDSTNGAWTPIGTLQLYNSTEGGQAFYFNGSAGGVKPTVSATWVGATTPGTSVMVILEYTGQAVVSPLDTSAYASTGTSSGPFQATVTSAKTNEQGIDILITGTASNWTVGNSWALRVGGAVAYEAADLGFAAANSSIQGKFTPDRSNNGSLLCVMAWKSTTSASALKEFLLLGVGQ